VPVHKVRGNPFALSMEVALSLPGIGLDEPTELSSNFLVRLPLCRSTTPHLPIPACPHGAVPLNCSGAVPWGSAIPCSAGVETPCHKICTCRSFSSDGISVSLTMSSPEPLSEFTGPIECGWVHAQVFDAVDNF